MTRKKKEYVHAGSNSAPFFGHLFSIFYTDFAAGHNGFEIDVPVCPNRNRFLDSSLRFPCSLGVRNAEVGSTGGGWIRVCTYVAWSVPKRFALDSEDEYSYFIAIS